MSTIKMTVDDWIAVEDNPRQRDTERHAAKARHLKQFSPTHAFVAAAKLPSGKLVKLDGHTRALLWKRKELDRPKAVEVSIVPAKSMDEVKELYTHYDNIGAVEIATDKVSGAFREINFQPKSTLLKTGRIGSALRTAMVGVGGWSAREQDFNVYRAINEFACEILALDDLNLGKGSASTGIIAAFLLSYRKHGESVIPFWSAVFANAGTKANGQMDGVQALNELMMQRRGMYGGQNVLDLCARALHACEKWLNGDSLSMIPRPLDLTSYITRKEKRLVA